MADVPVLGQPTELRTHQDGRFSIVFAWSTPPDALWLKAARDLMTRSGRESIEADEERLVIAFFPEDTDAALVDLDQMLDDANRHFRMELEHREASVRHVQEVLKGRFDIEGLPVREV